MYIYSDEFSTSRKRFAGVNGGLYRAKTALETRNCFTSAFLLGFDKQYHPPSTANHCLQGNIYSALKIEQCRRAYLKYNLLTSDKKEVLRRKGV